MCDYLLKVPVEIRELILDLAASEGLNRNDYNNNELIGFIEGAVSMYLFQQRQINALEVEIDLLESEIPIA